jgi:Na+/melibiose symporter-like transporter
MAGALLLIGQMADAIFSPVVGILSDKLPCNNYLYRVLGKRKTWHLLGVIMTTLSVPFTYNVPFGVTKESPEWQRFLYYSFFVTVFQSGWAATQVAHVTLITDLTPRTNERLTLNAYR